MNAYFGLPSTTNNHHNNNNNSHPTYEIDYNHGNFRFTSKDPVHINPYSNLNIMPTATAHHQSMYFEPHQSHFNLKEALAFIELVKPKRAYLTHISHRLGFHGRVHLTRQGCYECVLSPAPLLAQNLPTVLPCH